MGNVVIELEFFRHTMLISFGTFIVHPLHKYIHGFLHWKEGLFSEGGPGL